LVQNGKNAYLEIKTITNYVSRYTQQGSVFQPETDEYEQGIEWSVRPVISYDRKYITIRMRPKLEAFDAANSRTIIERRLTTIASTGDTNLAGVVEYPYFLPVLQITQMETYVTIPDGGTILMGGLIQDNRNENISGVPLLSSIPFVGRLTRSESRDYEKQNMVIMVQGKIIELE
jgi:type II secretory pathway component GspD/PulD (secretin)